jgi:Lrp/AsnC family leucine-responsive transcriptional regulator
MRARRAATRSSAWFRKAQAKFTFPSSMRLDALDIKIVGLLQQDARLSFREIAERLGSTTPTVSARIKALEDIGLLQGYRAHLDHSVLGGASYIVTLSMQPQSAHEALAAMKAMPGVYSVHLLPGGRIVSHVHLRPPAYALSHLHQALAQLPGLLTYDASEVLEGHEHPPVEDLPENVEVPCHQCHGAIHGDPVKGKFGERTHVFCCRQCLGTFRERFQSLQAAAAGPASPKRGAKPAKPATGARRHHH